MGNFFSQSFFIPEAPITERNCEDQNGRVFIVTGGYAGVGCELSRILYSRNATVYVAGRSEPKATSAISKIKAAVPNSKGRIEFLHLDLADLTTIKPAVESFTAKEDKLHVLVNNAAVMYVPAGSKTAQDHELQMGTNCLGPYLLYTLLKPILARTAASSPTASVRVAWAGSIGIDVQSPKPGGMKLDAASSKPETLDPQLGYGQTKVGNYFFARHLATAAADSPKDVVHVCFNPGNLKTELQRHWKGVAPKIAEVALLHPAVKGAHTELWAAVAPEITAEHNGAYVWPWGRFGGVRKDVEDAAKSKSQGGTGMADAFVAWCEKETKPFA